MGILIAIILLVLAGVGLVAGEGQEVGGIPASDLSLYLAVSGLSLIIVSMAVSGSRGRGLAAVRDFMVWALVGMALIVGYSYRAEIISVGYRVVGELSPPGETVAVDTRGNGERAVRIRKRPDGHFFAKVKINSSQLQMLVDTGASSVVLKQADAERVGINIRELTFSVPVQTANGATFAAPVKLASITVGNIEFKNIEALIAKPGALKDSLLGMSFLSRLRSYEFAGDFLTFRL